MRINARRSLEWMCESPEELRAIYNLEDDTAGAAPTPIDKHTSVGQEGWVLVVKEMTE